MKDKATKMQETACCGMAGKKEEKNM